MVLKKKSKNFFFFFVCFYLGKTDMVLGKKGGYFQLGMGPNIEMGSYL